MTMQVDDAKNGVVLSARVSAIIQNERDAEMYEAQANDCKWAAAEDIAAELAERGPGQQSQLAREIGKSRGHVQRMLKCHLLLKERPDDTRPPFNEIYNSPEVRGLPKPKDPEPLPTGGNTGGSKSGFKRPEPTPLPPTTPDPPRGREGGSGGGTGGTGRVVTPYVPPKSPEPDWGPDDLVSPSMTEGEAISIYRESSYKARAAIIDMLAVHDRIPDQTQIRVTTDEFFEYVKKVIELYGGYLSAD
jgi:hypothetical protein